jgi:hypothetical protein
VAGRAETYIAQGRPKLWVNFKALIGICTQNFGPSLAIWVNPAQFSCKGRGVLRTVLADDCLEEDVAHPVADLGRYPIVTPMRGASKTNRTDGVSVSGPYVFADPPPHWGDSRKPAAPRQADPLLDDLHACDTL